MLFQAKVTTNLNKRINEPFIRDDNRVDTLPPDTVINVETIHYGQAIDKNNKWFRDKDGFYFWSGGTNMANVYDPNADPAKTLINFNELIQYIPDKWRYTQGEGVKVAVLDTGINTDHPSLRSSNISLNKCYIKKSPTDEFHDSDGHGTKVAGVIAGRGESDNSGKDVIGIRGIAPLAEILNCKISVNGNFYPGRALNALKNLFSIYPNETIVINCSWNIDEYLDLRKEIEDLPENYLCICAAGNDTALCTPKIFFPALMGNCISVGYIQNPNLIGNLNDDLDFYMCVESIQSCAADGGYDLFKNCSMATAVVSGISALYISNLAKSSEKCTLSMLRTVLRTLQPISSTENSLCIFKNGGSKR